MTVVMHNKTLRYKDDKGLTKLQYEGKKESKRILIQPIDLSFEKIIFKRNLTRLHISVF